MARIDHVAFETDDPDRLAQFYERVLAARIVKTEGHPVMAISATRGSRSTREEDRAITQRCG
jgi:catechol 2,3-dioxygenase-like lactoylglutathione lyase family enzyme